MAAVHADAAVFGYTAYSQQVTAAELQKETPEIEQRKVFNPQDLCPCSRDDFILFAEFSEITGPIALLTIPSNIEENAEFEMNNLIMRIMSVDYQVNASGQFSFPQDVQVLHSDVTAGMHAYVHYCTLNDLKARGFVRPLCLAYVSGDSQKLHSLFPVLREQFLQITEIMKFNNRQWFMDEISKVITNLRGIQNRYFHWKKKEEDGITLTEEEQKLLGETKIDQLVHQYTEYKHMLHAVEPLLANQEYRDFLNEWKCGFVSAEGRNSLTEPYMAKLRYEILNKTGRNSLRSVVALSPWGLAAALWSLLCILRSQSNCRLEATLLMFPQTKSPALFPPFSIPAKEPPLEKEGLDMGANAGPSTSSHTTTCQPTDTKGNATAVHHKCHHSYSSECDEVCSSVLSKPDIAVETALRDPEYLKLITKVIEPFDSPADKSLLHEHARSQECLTQDSLDYLEANWLTSGNEASSSYHSVPESISELLALDRPGVIPHWSDLSSESSRCSASNESFLDISETDSWAEEGGEPNAEVQTWVTCVWSCGKPPIRHLAGHKILKFFQTFRKAAHHIVYSLLIGRTVVLAGSEKMEQKVGNMLISLIPMVPVSEKHALKTLRWHCGILVSSHIASYQLIGMCIPERLSVLDMISPRDKNSVTILDVESKQLFGPAYSGQLLSAVEIVPGRMPSDQSLLLFLQSVGYGLLEKLFLYRIANKGRQAEHSPGDVLRDMKLQGCDAEIIKYLHKIHMVMPKD